MCGVYVGWMIMRTNGEWERLTGVAPAAHSELGRFSPLPLPLTSPGMLLRDCTGCTISEPFAPTPPLPLTLPPHFPKA